MFLSDSYIYINDIRLHALHGVLPQEQLTGNDYIVNIRIGYDIAKAFASDDVADTLNYAEVYNIVKEEMLIPSKLIESCGWTHRQPTDGRIRQNHLNSAPHY